MTIGEVSKKCDVSVDTLRYYEKIGLIENVTKIGGKRIYSDDNIERIEFIRCMKSAGFTLDKIIEFISLYKKGNKTLKQRVNMLLSQKEKLLEEIEEKKRTLEFLNYKIDFYSNK